MINRSLECYRKKYVVKERVSDGEALSVRNVAIEDDKRIRKTNILDNYFIGS